MTTDKRPRIRLVQPPLTQLNSPYPAIYYLRSFLERRGYPVTTRDHSIMLFEKIFCRDGLSLIFDDIRRLRTKPDPVVEHFLSDEDRWLTAIDRTVAFLRGQDHEWGHLIGLTNGVLPEGPSCQSALENIRTEKGEVSVEDAPLLASKLLADIARLVTNTLDGGFSLVRYVPAPFNGGNAAFCDFSTVAAALDGYVMRTFYRPLLDAEWKTIAAEGENLLLGVSIPFPGCLAGALVCARSAKNFFGGAVTTVAGGGYVNTELRFIEEEKFFDYFDYLSFDRGYGSWEAILGEEKRRKERSGVRRNQPLYKTMYLAENDGIIRCDSINGTGSDGTNGRRIDDEAARSVFPDYSGIDFSRYIRPVDDANPMHRLWSDGRWLKAYAAHGCYWHNCAFCDTGLDYIRCYKPVDVEALFRHLTAQAEKTGVRGVHLVDEACPPAALVRLALLNRQAGLPLLFWGNIRFEKSFTADTAAVLAAGGLIGVSAGIEVASEKGFARIGKGIDLQGVVNACAAFKEAGILVHAYLIYGYWDEDDAEMAESAEILRQLFEAELLDSAFWHQFALTVHSRIYAEKQRGLHPSLRVTPRKGGKIFTLNDLSFKGEEKFSRYSPFLDMLLQSWMYGDTSQSLAEAFPFRVPPPVVAPDTVRNLLDLYARKRDARRSAPPLNKAKITKPLRVIFIASKPLFRPRSKDAELRWRWRFEDCALRAAPEAAKQTAALLEEASGGNGMAADGFYRGLEAAFGSGAPKVWKQLRRQGLCAPMFC